MNQYHKFLEEKATRIVYGGFTVDSVNHRLFDFQAALVIWALKKGKAAICADTGLGKTAMQLVWADEVARHTGKRVLIVAPLCVAQQTVAEGHRFGIKVKHCRSMSDIGDAQIVIINYEMMDHFDASQFIGVVLDESSILKGEDSKTRVAVIDKFSRTPYRLSCTATPSPNDYMEIGSQSEFLGVMRHQEMLAMFFTHDGGETSKWRLKGHGKTRFWEWLATWMAFIRNPADLGFDGSRYNLPEMNTIECCIETDYPPAKTMTEQRGARKVSIRDRCQKVADLVNASDDYWVIWCNLNEESTMLKELIPDAVEVHGSLPVVEKEKRLISFSTGQSRVIISKAKICGFGLNWQHCRNVAFAGVDYSYEKFYQAVRRCHRFGQQRHVDVYLVYTSAEGNVKQILDRKRDQMDDMADQMLEHMREFTRRDVLGTKAEKTDYNPNKAIKLPSFIGG
jgi:superfamily II DNA or RNA helicase